MFWDLVYYGWFALMGLAVVSVFGAAYWDATAPKRRLTRAARLQKMAEEAAAKEEATAAEAAEPVAEDAPVAVAAADEAKPPVAE